VVDSPKKDKSSYEKFVEHLEDWKSFVHPADETMFGYAESLLKSFTPVDWDRLKDDWINHNALSQIVLHCSDEQKKRLARWLEPITPPISNNPTPEEIESLNETRCDRFVKLLNKWETDPAPFDESYCEHAEDALEWFEPADWDQLEREWRSHTQKWQLLLLQALRWRGENEKRLLMAMMLCPDDDVSAEAATTVDWYLKDDRLENLPVIHQRLSQTVLRCTGEEKELITEFLRSIEPFI
jgi:hypothetical protein